jgi:hypothetical protein
VKNNGFLQLRRGLFEHIRDGRMSHLAALCFIYITTQADTRTGIWNGSAGALAGELSISARTCRGVLDRLSARGYIKRFPIPGKHSCYPILVHKFLVTDGKHRGLHLNAVASSKSDLRFLVSEHAVKQNGTQHVKEDGELHGEYDVKQDGTQYAKEDGRVDGEHGASQKKTETRNGTSKTQRTAKNSATTGLRFTVFFDTSYRAYSTKNRQPPTWGGKDRANLKRFLMDQARVELPEWERRFSNYLDSTEGFIRKQGHALSYFVTHFDTFKDGPILEKGGVNGVGKNSSGALRADDGKYDDVRIHQFSNCK